MGTMQETLRRKLSWMLRRKIGGDQRNFVGNVQCVPLSTPGPELLETSGQVIGCFLVRNSMSLVELKLWRNAGVVPAVLPGITLEIK